MLNRRGQAFDVFKLLIAAVVAVVILTLLLSIIQRINIFGQGNPQTEAGKIVNDLVRQRGVVNSSGEVVFESNIGVSNIGIADATRGSLAPSQVCISPGEFEEDNRFEFVPGKSVIYKGSAKQNASVIAICDTGSAIANYRGRGNYFDDYTRGGIESGWEGVSDCECVNDNFHQTCCVVALKRFRG